MNNKISKTVTGIIYQGQRALPGVLANLESLGYSEAQGEAFNTRITDAIMARDEHAEAKVTLGASRSSYASKAKEARTLAMTGRDALKPYLGREHSAAWAAAGFVNNLEVPRDPARLLSVVQGLKSYLTAHADQEVVAANVTATRFGTLATEVMTRIAAVDTAKANAITAANERDAKAKLVRTELSLLLAKLSRTFGPFDAMWEQVGFNRPGFISVPAIPLNLTAILVGPSAVALKWDAAERAARYRIWKKVVGVDTEMVEVTTREDLDFILEGLPTGKTIELAVSAVNDGGESQLSEVKTVVTE